jgi:hypothetical protein
MVANEYGLYQCPFCPCVFCSEIDLSLHLKALISTPAPVNGNLVNEVDHKRNWERMLLSRDHEFISNG